MITKKEKFELRHQWRNDMVKVLRNIADAHLYSPQIVALKKDDPLFEDSCNYVSFHSAIMDLARTLEACNKYGDIIYNDDEQ